MCHEIFASIFKMIKGRKRDFSSIIEYFKIFSKTCLWYLLKSLITQNTIQAYATFEINKWHLNKWEWYQKSLSIQNFNFISKLTFMFETL